MKGKRISFDPTTERGAVNRELAKERIIMFLRGRASRGEYWQSANACSSAASVTPQIGSALLVELLFEGFLILRDSDTDQVKLLYALKKGLRDEKP